MRLIDADKLKDYIDMQSGRPFIGCTVGDAMKIMIDEQPTIEERKKGRWIPLQLSIAYPPYQCSYCFGNAPMVMVGTGRLKKGHLEALLTDYCPNCGADMRGDGDA